MTYARAFGLRFPIASDSLQHRRTRYGDAGKPISGRPSGRRRALLDEYDGRTPPMHPEIADAWEAILHGRGHRIAFDRDLFSAAGLGPDAGSWVASIVELDASTGRVAGYPLRAQVEITTASMVYDLEAGERWTILYWHADEVDTDMEHRVVTSDGAKWVSGVRNDAATFDDIRVDEDTGALIIDPGVYGDVFFLPVDMPADMVEEVIAWTTRPNPSVSIVTADGVSEGKAICSVQGIVGAVAGEVAMPRPSKVGPGFSFNNGSITFYSLANANAASTSQFSIEFWMRLRTIASEEVQNLIRSGADAADGYHLSAVCPTGESDVYRLVAGVERATTDAAAVSTRTFAAGDDVHVVMTFDPTAGISLFADGVELPLSTDTTGSGSVVSDAGDPVIIGGTTTGGSPAPFFGTMSGPRIYRRALSAAQVEALHDEQKDGAQSDDERHMPDLPSMVMRGSAFEGLDVRVMPSVSSQSIQGFGGDSGEGWIEAARALTLTLTAIPQPFPYLPAHPFFSAVLDDGLTIESTSRRAVVGDWTITQAGTTAWLKWPFSQARVRSLAGSAGRYETLPEGVSRMMTGAWAICGFAVVFRDSVSGTSTVFAMQRTSDTALKLGLTISDTHGMTVSARDSEGATLLTHTNAIGVPVGQWCLVGFAVNLTDKSLSVFTAYDDDTGNEVVEMSTADAAFPRGSFAAFGGAVNRIGAGTTGSDIFDGAIGNAQLFTDYMPDAGSVRAWWRSVKAGVFG